jgi:hypothetical protein
MTWFKVDDSFHSHPKVLAASPAALGLWVVAGSWCGANLSDGLVPDHVLPRLLPDAAELARQLVAAGLWKRMKGGYRFHDWAEFNPRKVDVEVERKAARERMRNLRSTRKTPGQKPNGSPEHGANVRELFVTPTRPDQLPDKRALRTRADFVADYELLRSEGYTRRQIAERMRMTYAGVAAAYRRAVAAGDLTPDRRTA